MTDDAFPIQTAAPEAVAEAIGPTLDAFALQALTPLRRAADTLYEMLLDSVQDYLRENGQWNISEEIARCREIERTNRDLLLQIEGLNVSMLAKDRRLENGESELDVTRLALQFWHDAALSLHGELDHVGCTCTFPDDTCCAYARITSAISNEEAQENPLITTPPPQVRG